MNATKLTMKEWREICRKPFGEALDIAAEYFGEDLHSEDVIIEHGKDAFDNMEWPLVRMIAEALEGAEYNDEGLYYYKWDISAGIFDEIEQLKDGRELYEAFIDYCDDFPYNRPAAALPYDDGEPAAYD